MRFRFTIRETLFFTAAIGLGVGWWVDHTRLSLKLDKVATDLSALKKQYSLDNLHEGWNTFTASRDRDPIYWKSLQLKIAPRTVEEMVEFPKEPTFGQ